MTFHSLTHIRPPCRSISRRLGSDVFQKLYENLKEARQRRDTERGVTEEALNCPEDEAAVGFQVDQLLFYEEELQRRRQLQGDRASVWRLDSSIDMKNIC